MGLSRNATDPIAPLRVLPGNRDRVAIVVSPQTATGLLVDLRMGEGTSGNKLGSFADAVVMPVILRIEDLGQAITGEIWSGGLAGGAVINLTEILSTVIQPAIIE